MIYRINIPEPKFPVKRGKNLPDDSNWNTKCTPVKWPFAFYFFSTMLYKFMSTVFFVWLLYALNGSLQLVFFYIFCV